MKKENNDLYFISIKFNKEEGGFVAWIPALNNIAAMGTTEEEARANVKKVEKDYLKYLAANNKPIPKSDLN